MSASRSAANSPLRCSSHRSAASPSSPDDRQLARARLFLRRKRRTPTGPSSAPSPQQIALNDPLEASRAATAASLSSDRFRHRESLSSCLPLSTLTQPALVLFPNQIRIYSQQAPSQKSPISTVSRQWPSLQPTGYCAIVLFEFELDEFETRGPCVLDRTRLARSLPDEVTVVGRHAAVGVPRNDFGEHAAMDIDAQAWSRLRDLSC